MPLPPFPLLLVAKNSFVLRKRQTMGNTTQKGKPPTPGGRGKGQESTPFFSPEIYGKPCKLCGEKTVGPRFLFFFFFSVCAIQLAIPIGSQIRRWSHDFSLFPRVWPSTQNRRSTTRDFPRISEQEKHARIQSAASKKKSSRNNGSEQGNEFKFRLPKRKIWLYYLWACALCTATTLDFTARLFISKEKNEKSLISKRETVWGGVRPTSTHAPDGVEKEEVIRWHYPGIWVMKREAASFGAASPCPGFPEKLRGKALFFSKKCFFVDSVIWHISSQKRHSLLF